MEIIVERSSQRSPATTLGLCVQVKYLHDHVALLILIVYLLSLPEMWGLWQDLGRREYHDRVQVNTIHPARNRCTAVLFAFGSEPRFPGVHRGPRFKRTYLLAYVFVRVNVALSC